MKGPVRGVCVWFHSCESPNGKVQKQSRLTGCIGLAGREWVAREVIAKGYGVSFWDENVLKLTADVCISVRTLKVFESCTLNGCTLQYVNYIPKLVFQKVQALYPRKSKWSIRMKRSVITSQKNGNHAWLPFRTLPTLTVYLKCDSANCWWGCRTFLLVGIII